MEHYDKVDLADLEHFQSALEIKLNGIGEWHKVINTIGKEALCSHSDFDDLVNFEGNFSSALMFILERIKSMKSSLQNSTISECSDRSKCLKCLDCSEYTVCPQCIE